MSSKWTPESGINRTTTWSMMSVSVWEYNLGLTLTLRGLDIRSDPCSQKALQKCLVRLFDRTEHQ